MPIYAHATWIPDTYDGSGLLIPGHEEYTYDLSYPDGHYWPHVAYYDVSQRLIADLHLQSNANALRGDPLHMVDHDWIVLEHLETRRMRRLILDTPANRLWLHGYDLVRRAQKLSDHFIYKVYELGCLDPDSDVYDPPSIWGTFTLNPETMSNRVTERNRPAPLITFTDMWTPEKREVTFSQVIGNTLPLPRYSYVWGTTIPVYSNPFLRVSPGQLDNSEVMPYPNYTPKKASYWAEAHHRHPLYGQGVSYDGPEDWGYSNG